MRIFWQQRPMHICPKRMAVNRSFCAVLCVVAITLENFAQRFGSAKIGTSPVVLKADESTLIPTNCHVACTAWYLWPFVNSPGIEYTQSLHIGTFRGMVILCQQLEASTNRQDGHIILNGGP